MKTEIVNPSLNIEEVGDEYFFISASPVGERERKYKHGSQIKYLTDIKDEVVRLRNERERDNVILEATLKALGVNTDVKMTNMSLLCQTLLNALIIPKNKDMFGYELDSESGYIKKILKLDGVLVERPELPEYMYFVDGVLTFDEEKYNSMMGAVL